MYFVIQYAHMYVCAILLIEMWDFASPYEAAGNQKSQEESSCRIYFDKFVDFVHRLFLKWKKLQVSANP